MFLKNRNISSKIKRSKLQTMQLKVSSCLNYDAASCLCSFLMVLWAGRQCIIVVILTYFLDACGDTKLTKVALDMIFTPLSKIIKKPALGLNSIQKPHQM